MYICCRHCLFLYTIFLNSCWFSLHLFVSGLFFFLQILFHSPFLRLFNAFITINLCCFHCFTSNYQWNNTNDRIEMKDNNNNKHIVTYFMVNVMQWIFESSFLLTRIYIRGLSFLSLEYNFYVPLSYSFKWIDIWCEREFGDYYEIYIRYELNSWFFFHILS